MRPLGGKATAASRLRGRIMSALRTQMPAVAVRTDWPKNWPGTGSWPVAVRVITSLAASVALEGTSTVTVTGVEALGAIWLVSVGVTLAGQSAPTRDMAKELFWPLLLITLAEKVTVWP